MLEEAQVKKKVFECGEQKFCDYHVEMSRRQATRLKLEGKIQTGQKTWETLSNRQIVKITLEEQVEQEEKQKSGPRVETWESTNIEEARERRDGSRRTWRKGCQVSQEIMKF